MLVHEVKLFSLPSLAGVGHGAPADHGRDEKEEDAGELLWCWGESELVVVVVVLPAVFPGEVGPPGTPD